MDENKWILRAIE